MRIGTMVPPPAIPIAIRASVWVRKFFFTPSGVVNSYDVTAPGCLLRAPAHPHPMTTAHLYC